MNKLYTKKGKQRTPTYLKQEKSLKLHSQLLH